MAELDPNIPLNYLSGKYTQNYYVPNTFSDAFAAFDTARKNQELSNELDRRRKANEAVAAARSRISNEFSAQQSAEEKAIQDKIDEIDAELASIDQHLAVTTAESQKGNRFEDTYPKAAANSAQMENYTPMARSM